MDEKITGVRYGFHAADLSNNWDSADLETYDEQASAARYAEQVETRLREFYPGAEVEVVYDFGAGGVEGFGLHTEINGYYDEDGVATVEQLAGEVYQEFAWIVSGSPDDD